jgi:hypothetical protein
MGRLDAVIKAAAGVTEGCLGDLVEARRDPGGGPARPGFAWMPLLYPGKSRTAPGVVRIPSQLGKIPRHPLVTPVTWPPGRPSDGRRIVLYRLALLSHECQRPAG